jgi:hypothetical protein
VGWRRDLSGHLFLCGFGVVYGRDRDSPREGQPVTSGAGQAMIGMVRPPAASAARLYARVTGNVSAPKRSGYRSTGLPPRANSDALVVADLITLVLVGELIPATVVLVHGNFLGPWSWSDVTEILASAQVPAKTIRLPSSTTDASGSRGNLYADATQVRAMLDSLHGPVVLEPTGPGRRAARQPSHLTNRARLPHRRLPGVADPPRRRPRSRAAPQGPEWEAVPHCPFRLAGSRLDHA